ncbi:MULTISPECIES: IS200/IS605 family transposase [Legionella]|uniref:Transposase IS200 like protein n=2 Tax=Legionella TaxID=445 RepID=A0A0W0VJ59_9GAMM|nr:MULTISPECIES: IS200/IS605 family transposase [Legionella]KTD20145.1 Transposase IS200 like protein [Legionella londiniensis]MCP0913689.1 IS200/IS605 family transposase [Legionella sp. 27cVA30]RUQ78852.1 IS200/IS605 family transposase [Legionella septentrionalis]RUR08734.1 IS200/IS605 family transposase [Legionella septentrionalis]STX94312.1 Transposase and inactivated derivatives [Legionella londiniensis]
MTLKRASHCVYQTHYHIVFPVKYRKSLLSDEITSAIKSIAVEIGERYEIDFEQLGCDKNHIHILCSFHPKYSIGEVVRKFKSITARELFKQYPLLKKELWGGEFWSDGYYVSTVGERGDWKVVERYVKNQGKESETKQLRLL